MEYQTREAGENGDRLRVASHPFYGELSNL
jgi:hypothetical protein